MHRGVGMKSNVKILIGVVSTLAVGGALCCGASGAVLFGSRLFSGTEAVPQTATTHSAAPPETSTVTRSVAPATPGAAGPLDPALIGADGIGDPYFPKMGNGGYDVRHYDLSIRVDMEAEEIDAVAILNARSSQALGRFNLDLLKFDISSVRVDGTEAGFAQEDGELIITPAAVIPKDADFTVAVAYRGRPGGGAEYGGIDYLEGWNFHPGGVIVAGEPTGAETWFPSNNHPADKATFEFHITVAKPYTAAANGVLQETTDNGDGTRTFDWAMDNPMATYLSTVAVGRFELLEGASEAGRPYRNFVDVDILGDLDPGLNALPAAMDFFSGTFGPYPFAACGVVVHNISLQFSLENQTLVNMGYNFSNETVTVHELAHQWFGDSVSVAVWKDIWLNEGFASYAEGLWWEHTKGESGLVQDLTRRYQYIANLPLSQVNLLGDPGPDHLFDVEVYFRGALTLHALRSKVGDPAFFRILQTYFAQFKDKNATTEEFIDLAEEISNQPLDDFFQAWLFEKELPDMPELGLTS
jgi:aminopeptidase N